MGHGTLRSLPDVLGEHVGEGVTENPLLHAVTDLEAQWNLEGQLDQGQIEEGDPRLDALAHGNALQPLQLGAAKVAYVGAEELLAESAAHLPVHAVSAEELIRAVAREHHLDTTFVHSFEEWLGDHGVDDVAVFGEFRHAYGCPNVIEVDIAGAHFDDLVMHAEILGQTAGETEVIAVICSYGEGHTVGVHLTDVQQGEGAVEASREDDAHRQVGVHPDADAVDEGFPHQTAGFLGVVNGVLPLGQAHQIHIRRQLRRGAGSTPTVVAGSHLGNRCTGPDQRLY